jgi:hypothetical protein
MGTEVTVVYANIVPIEDEDETNGAFHEKGG